MLGIARANPVQDWLKFLTDLAAVTWKENLPFVDQLTLLPPLAAGLGVLTLCGPLFVAFWVLAARSQQTRPFSSQLLARTRVAPAAAAASTSARAIGPERG
jgi:hypothetical protein